MPVKATRMDEAEISRIAEKCRKWSERNLGVVRALLVEGDSMTDAAAKHEMSKQQANVLRTRFLAKAGQERIEGPDPADPDQVVQLLARIGKVLAQVVIHGQALLLHLGLHYLRDQRYTAAAGGACFGAGLERGDGGGAGGDRVAELALGNVIARADLRQCRQRVHTQHGPGLAIALRQDQEFGRLGQFDLI